MRSNSPGRARYLGDGGAGGKDGLELEIANDGDVGWGGRTAPGTA